MLQFVDMTSVHKLLLLIAQLLKNTADPNVSYQIQATAMVSTLDQSSECAFFFSVSPTEFSTNEQLVAQCYILSQQEPDDAQGCDACGI